MKKLTLLLIVLAGYFSSSQDAKAHAIWIESDPKANTHQTHDVRIFYGEYASGEIEATEKWYSDLKDLEVWLISPSQQKTKLVLRDASNHLTTSFVPAEEGLYYLTTLHTTKDLGGTTRYEFSSVVPVHAGGSTLGTLEALPMPLAVVSAPKYHRDNQLIELQVWKDKTPFAEAEVLIMSPSGWVKTLKTDQQGKVSFTPLSEGKYVIETSDYKKEAGEWHGKSFTHSWQGSTTYIMVQ